MAVPLPLNTFNLATQPDVYEAYDRCLDLERRESVVEQWGYLTVLICARFLGQMLRQAPVEPGRQNVAADILEQTDDEKLQCLANYYKDLFLRVFYQQKDLDSSSRPPTPESQANEKDKALERDGYRCVMTGKIDWKSHENIFVPDPQVTTITKAAHIFDWSSNQQLGDEEKTQCTAVVLQRFGGISTVKELSGPDIHRLENILTLGLDFHILFDRLAIWLERADDAPPNVYRPAAVAAGCLRGLPLSVKFITPDPINLPLPDPRYLAFHTACAKVAHLSGAGEYIDNVLWDLEDTRVLASNGDSADLLYHALVRST
ncbi:hypothetical protein C0991_012534 [Blastosporella zonata]|nr:hypothetical protein C0991_012534 [Blastosporella zonata]